MRPEWLTEVAPGVHRIEHAYVNCYLVEGDRGGLTLVDTGLPATWHRIGPAVRLLGHHPDDVVSVVLTHAHVDHTGSAAIAQERLRVPVRVHHDDVALATHPYRSAHEKPRATYPLRHRAAVPVLWAMLRARAWDVSGVEGVVPSRDGEHLPVPGGPVVVHTPGHTAGHCAFHLPGRDVLLTGDALVTLDPWTGGRGPQVVAGAATADSEAAVRSLDRLAATGARTVLPGHGEPWTDGVVAAAERARVVGAH